ncbi:MAG: hypothetical protein CFE46_14675 [Burkholderiales bacterium PBB6]|nr:MAG: hypothetical protein CFE46_14675 [Burkholderiales bacterium PBB6]
MRQELRLEPAAAGSDGAARWRLYDPLRHRFFLLGDADVKLLSLWPCGNSEALQHALAATAAPLDREQLDGLLSFLKDNQLVQAGSAEARQRRQAQQQSGSGFRGLVQGLLGWRLPLWRPQAFLQATLPWVSVLWCTPAIVAWVLLSVLGLVLAGRQWDLFVSTFADFLTPGGTVAFAIALFGLKVVHELGHGYAAVHHGCRVGSMGVCVTMFVPMLYTETGDVARLDHAGPRMWVASGGVLAETMIAGLATLAWSLLPDGTARSIAFVLATSSWLMSLAVNLNPLSRFDGYYFLSDALRVDNLQPRALDYSGWALGRLMFGAIEQPPEVLARRTAFGFILYGSLVWCWRMALNASIAWLAYTYLFKAAGVAVGVLAAWWLIGKPLMRQATRWWRLRQGVTRRRQAALALFGGGLLLLALLPLDRHVAVPAMLGWQRHVLIEAPENAQVMEVLVQAGQQVKAGQVLMRLSSPELRVKQAEAALNRLATAERLNRIGGDAKDRAEATVLDQRLLEADAEVRGLQDRAQLLDVRASEDGVVVDLPLHLQAGQWVRPGMPLGRVLYGRVRDARGFVSERELPRLQAGARGRFVAEDPSLAALDLTVSVIEPTAAETITPDALSSLHGGFIPTQADRSGKAVPLSAQHRVVFEVDASPLATATHLPMEVRGEVRLKAEPQSLAAQAGSQLWRLLMAELRD